MIVNGFWFGEIGEVQQRCIDSWEKNGYEFNLWVYDLDIEVPEPVIVRNANHNMVQVLRVFFIFGKKNILTK